VWFYDIPITPDEMLKALEEKDRNARSVKLEAGKKEAWLVNSE
jgi:hypothetical protein